jgi:hypothetical protein
MSGIFDGFSFDLSEIDPREFDAFERQREIDLKDVGKRGLRRPQSVAGWYCGNCRNFHAPDVHTCPEPPRTGSLQERIGQVHNG